MEEITLSSLGIENEVGIENVVGIAISECISSIKRASSAAGQVATGRTLRSLEGRLRREGDVYIAQILGRRYFGALETGRGPYTGGPEAIKQFNRNLMDWFKARHIHSEMTDEQLEMEANRLRWYINKYGTRLYRRGGRTDIFTPAYEGFVQTLQKSLSESFALKARQLFTEGFQGFGNSTEITIDN